MQKHLTGSFLKARKEGFKARNRIGPDLVDSDVRSIYSSAEMLENLALTYAAVSSFQVETMNLILRLWVNWNQKPYLNGWTLLCAYACLHAIDLKVPYPKCQ